MLRFDSCPNCFAMLGGHEDCPVCGYNYTKDEKKPSGVLPPFTLLADRYLTGKVLGKGGFGVTYVAMDIESAALCAVKEYMPSEYSVRGVDKKSVIALSDRKARYVFEHGRAKFVEEAKTLYALKSNPVVVDISDYFTENNTAYLVMEYLDGTDLRRMCKSSGGKISPELAKEVLVTVATAMVDIHKMGILHRDLSPENIYITKNNEIKLIDFGAARDYVQTQNSGMSILLKPGFAPPEQYSSKGSHGPWTDVYGLCSTFYTIVSGKSLIDAMYRYRGEIQPTLYSLGCPVTKKTSDVIEKGMELDYEKRYRSFEELLRDLDIDIEELDLYNRKNKQPKDEAVKPVKADADRDGAPSPKPPVSDSAASAKPQDRSPQRPISAQDGGASAQARPEADQSRSRWQGQYGGYDNGMRQGSVFVNSPNDSYARQQNPSGQQDHRPYHQQYPQRESARSNSPQIDGQPISNAFHSAPGASSLYLGLLSETGRVSYSIPVPPDQEIRIGRSKNCEFIISDDSDVSRVHCTLKYVPATGEAVLTDYSSNGTYFENNLRLNKLAPYSIRPVCRFYLVQPRHMLILFEATPQRRY